MATANKFLTGIDLNNQRGINFGDPSSATDAANKQYVDNVARGLAIKKEVTVATTGALPAGTYSSGAKTFTVTATGVQSIDGHTLALNEDVLVKDQVTGSQNGLYTVTTAGAVGVSLVLTRRADADSTADLANGLTVTVMQGTTNGDKMYNMTNDTPPVLDTDALTFGVVGGGGVTLTAGNGITLPGNAITVNPASGGGIAVAAGGVSVDRTKVPNLYASNIGDNSTTLITVTHNLNTLDITPFCREISSGEFVWPNMKATGVNTATYEFPTAPTTGQYRAIIHG
jgi:hypothetical protein